MVRLASCNAATLWFAADHAFGAIPFAIFPKDAQHVNLQSKRRGRVRGVPELQGKRTGWQQVLRPVRGSASIPMPVLWTRQSDPKQVLLTMRGEPQCGHVVAADADSRINNSFDISR
jgi:hypothetical protein